MKRIAEVYAEATGLGLRLTHEGNRIGILPAGRCPPAFKEVLRMRKLELLAFLEGKALHLPPDCVEWIYIARQVMAGEFDGADRSMRGSIIIGLRDIEAPIARRALRRLEGSRPGYQEPSGG